MYFYKVQGNLTWSKEGHKGSRSPLLLALKTCSGFEVLTTSTGHTNDVGLASLLHTTWQDGSLFFSGVWHLHKKWIISWTGKFRRLVLEPSEVWEFSITDSWIQVVQSFVFMNDHHVDQIRPSAWKLSEV